MSEELQAILQLVEQSGEGAFLLACLWMGKSFVLDLGVILASLYTVIKVANLINAAIYNQSLWDELRKLAGCSCPYGGVTRSDMHQVKSYVSSLLPSKG